MSFALQRNLKYILAKKGLNIFQAEKICALNKHTMRFIIEGNSTNPSNAVLQSISSGLEVSIEELCGTGIMEEKLKMDKLRIAIFKEVCTSVIDAIDIEQVSKRCDEIEPNIIKVIEEVFRYTITYKNSQQQGNKDPKYQVDKNFIYWTIDKYIK